MRTLNAATVSRLPHYYQILRAMEQRGREYVSSEGLSRLLGIDASLVRKDLAWVATGVQKVGYHVPSTVTKIQEMLGMNNSKEAFLVGVGSLGRALLGYTGFGEYGLKIVAAFDADEAKVGQVISDIEILPVSSLPALVRRLHIKTGILTVPYTEAQHTADQMVSAGIVAIWNFAPVTLTVPDGVIVRNENLAAGFALLNYELEKKLKNRSGR